MTTSWRTLDGGQGAVRVEDVYDTDIDDLWTACTTPERLARWIATVTGDLRVGGAVQATFTSTWSGPAVVEICDAPHHLVVRTQPGTDEEGEIEAWLTTEGEQTRLVVEERGLEPDRLALYAAGWQVHLDDLGRSLRTGAAVHPDGWSAQAPAPDWHRRWAALVPELEGEQA